MSEAKKAWIKKNLKKGEKYAGILLGKEGQRDQHIILIPNWGQDLTWAQAKAFAKNCGGELPTRREQSLLFANLKDQIKPGWYWSSEQFAGFESYAWLQSFDNGYQSNVHKDDKYRVVLVRRVAI
ncbi:MAG: DUF1566 domain-containing protein [Sterolibacterium sp.]